MANQICIQRPAITIGAYQALHAVGGLLTFQPVNAGCGAQWVNLKHVEILDVANAPAEAALELHLFTDSTLAVADAAAFSVTDAQFATGVYLGVIVFATPYAATTIGTQAGAKVAIQDGLNRAIPLTKGKVYGQLVCTGTPTFGAVDELIVAATFAPWLV